MNKLTELIKRHQVVAFFVLAFAISWGLWIPILPLIYSGKQPLLTPLLIFGAYMPAVVGIVITRIIDPQPRHGNRKPEQYLNCTLRPYSDGKTPSNLS